jgi:hypothetical protein
LPDTRSRKAPGAAAKILASQQGEIRRWVIEGSPKRGSDDANWPDEELADHLYKTLGIRTPRSAMQRFGEKNGISVYRATYHYPRGDLDKEQGEKDIAMRENSTVG